MFIFAAMMFNFIIQLSYIVTEKELRLREAMKQMGMRSSAYWSSWLATNTAINLAQCLLLCAAGAIFQIDFFLKNSFVLYFVFFFATAMSLSCAAFFLSSLLSRAEQARNLVSLCCCLFAGGRPCYQRRRVTRPSAVAPCRS